jgi:EpsI family protein
MVTASRLFVFSGLMLAVSGYLAMTRRAERVPIREALNACPMQLSNWHGERAPDFDERTLAILGVDEYINRVYLDTRRRPIGLYVGYYGSQRQGDTMHSPLNCLPGAGWSPVSFFRMPIAVQGAPDASGNITVNRYVIEKGLDRQLVLYWYQSHGRVVASEYWGKVYMVLDAIRTNRTDGALVRVIAPITTTEAEAEHQAVAFAQVLYPLLERYLPS